MKLIANGLDNVHVKADFYELYRLMNGMDLRGLDKIIFQSVDSVGIMKSLVSQ